MKKTLKGTQGRQTWKGGPPLKAAVHTSLKTMWLQRTGWWRRSVGHLGQSWPSATGQVGNKPQARVRGAGERGAVGENWACSIPVRRWLPAQSLRRLPLGMWLGKWTPDVCTDPHHWPNIAGGAGTSPALHRTHPNLRAKPILLPRLSSTPCWQCWVKSIIRDRVPSELGAERQ